MPNAVAAVCGNAPAGPLTARRPVIRDPLHAALRADR